MGLVQSPRYEHERLDLRSDSIRVLQIEPGESHSIIRCVIRQQSLHGSPHRKHVCLSYMWGEGPLAQTILVNGKPFQIRQNLWRFLSSARRAKLNDLLWIDAICINQHDLLERNHQVHKMAEIYSQASRVLIWLGDIDDHLMLPVMDAAMVLRRVYSAYSIFHHAEVQTSILRGIDKGDDSLARSATVQSALSTSIHPNWRKGFQQIMLSRYWDRQWVMQEILLGQHVKIFTGSGTIDLKELAKFLKHTELWCDQDREERLERKKIALLVALGLKSTWEAARETSAVVPSSVGDSFKFFCRVKYFQDNGHWGLKSLLHHAEVSQCFDPRDKIYGILGLSDRLRDLPVRYDINAAWLAINVIDHVRAWTFDHVQRLMRSLQRTMKIQISHDCMHRTQLPLPVRLLSLQGPYIARHECRLLITASARDNEFDLDKRDSSVKGGICVSCSKELDRLQRVPIEVEDYLRVSTTALWLHLKDWAPHIKPSSKKVSPSARPKASSGKRNSFWALWE